MRLPVWTMALPPLGIVAALVPGAGYALIVFAAILIGCVVAAVHHAEVIAHRVGEPFGTLILAIAITVIEVALIVSLMLAGEGPVETLARDTVFAAIMIVVGGIMGASLLWGGIRHGEQQFSLQGASSAMCVLAALAVLTLVLPNFTISAAGPTYTPSQLAFVAVVSLILYLTFVFVQTVRHRDYFMPDDEPVPGAHSPRPNMTTTAMATGFLLVALVAVVLLAKGLSVAVERTVIGAGLPLATVGVVLAATVLAPEALAAMRAAKRNDLQTSLNLALGSALATIGLTIPAVAVASLAFGLPLALGIDGKATTLLALSLLVAAFTLGTGRTTVLHGVVHLTIFAVYLFTTVVP